MDKPIQFTKKCPVCQKDIIYKHKTSLDRAHRQNAKCKVCANLGSNNPMYGRKGEKSPYYGKRPAASFKGHRHTQEAKDKMSEAAKGRETNGWKGKSHTDETKIKISHHARNRTEEHREKLRNAMCERIEKWGGNRSFNLEACQIFDSLNNELYLAGRHALNGGEKILSGYLLDYYDDINKIYIEWDEPEHLYSTKVMGRDIKKHNRIISFLGNGWLVLRWSQRDQAWRDGFKSPRKSAGLKKIIKTIILQSIKQYDRFV